MEQDINVKIFTVNGSAAVVLWFDGDSNRDSIVWFKEASLTYPALYRRVATKALDKVATRISKKETEYYRRRMGCSRLVVGFEL